MNLKKTTFVLCLFIISLASRSWAGDGYQMSPVSVTTTAGVGAVVQFVATQGLGQDTTYNRTGLITAIHPTRGSIPVTPSSVDFSAGTTSAVSLLMNIAGPIEIHVCDSILTTLTSWAGYVGVGANAIDHYTVLYSQGPVMRITQPGSSAPGYTPSWLTITAGAPCAVSVVALDQFNNTTPIGATITVSDYSSTPNWTDIQTQYNGIASFLWTPNPPQAAEIFTFFINVSGPAQPVWGNGVSLQIPSTYYIWISAPTTAYAGTPFSVQVSASDSNLYNNPQPSASSYNLQLYPLLVDASPGTGLLTPQTIMIGTDGTKTQNFTYTKAETIYLDVSKISPSGGRTVERAYSPLIQVMASTPAQISASASPAAIQAQHTTTISATVVDAYQNLVPDVPVAFSITQGSAECSLSAATAQSNASGVAQVTLTGGIINETVTVQARSNTLIASVSVRVSVAPPNGTVMTNYPNPFDPNLQKTSVNYYLNYESEVEIRVYDAFGRVVLAKDVKPGQGSGDFAGATLAGGAGFLWDGKNGEGRTVANGIYLVKVKAKSRNGTQEFKRRVGVIK